MPITLMAKIRKSGEDTSLYGLLFAMRMMFKPHHSDGKDNKKSEWKHSPFTFYCLNLLFPSYISRNGEYAVDGI